MPSLASLQTKSFYTRKQFANTDAQLIIYPKKSASKNWNLMPDLDVFVHVRCTGTPPWTGTFIKHWITLNNTYAANPRTGTWKFIVRAVSSCGSSRRSNKSKLRWKTICCDVPPALLTWCQVCSSAFYLSLLFCTTKNGSKGFSCCKIVGYLLQRFD